jgi:hypothetical protein
MVAGALVWWMLPGVGGSGNASANPGGGSPVHHQSPASSTSSTATETRSTAGGQAGQQPAVTHHPVLQHASRPPAQRPAATQHPIASHPTAQHRAASRRAQPPPTGPCDPTKVSLAVVAHDTHQGAGTTVGLRMSTSDGSTCTLGITPNLLETRITSGDVVVWQSSSCPDALPAKNVVVRPKPAVVYSYTWDGQFNPDSCSATNRIASAGYYWAEAALIGGEPHQTQFQVTKAPAARG